MSMKEKDNINIKEKTNTIKKTKKTTWIVLGVLIAIIATFAIVTVHTLKEYTRKNTWVDLEVEVHKTPKGSQATEFDKQEVFTGLVAGDIVPIVSGCDFEIKEIHPNGVMVIDVKNAYTHDNPMLNSVQYPREVSLREGESKTLYLVGDQWSSYVIKLTVKANYYR